MRSAIVTGTVVRSSRSDTLIMAVSDRNEYSIFGSAENGTQQADSWIISQLLVRGIGSEGANCESTSLTEPMKSPS